MEEGRLRDVAGDIALDVFLGAYKGLRDLHFIRNAVKTSKTLREAREIPCCDGDTRYFQSTKERLVHHATIAAEACFYALNPALLAIPAVTNLVDLACGGLPFKISDNLFYGCSVDDIR